MRSGIPLSARLFAMASAIGVVASSGGTPSKAMVSAARQIDNRKSYRFNSGTEQRKSRKNARRVHNNGRR